MKYNHTIETIQNDLKEIGEIVESFNQSDNIRQIDIDIVLTKMRDLYDLLLFIKKTTNVEHETSKLENLSNNNNEEDTEIYSKNFQDDNLTNTIENDSAIHIEHGEVPKDEIEEEKDETQVENSVDKSTNDNTDKKDIVDTSENNEDKSLGIIAEKFQTKSTSLNDSLGKNHLKQDVSTKIQSKPIKDLSPSIGVNDKFLFIKSLFKGDKVKYNDTIEKLNGFQNFEEALEYIQSDFDWAPNNEAADKLLELVKRKFW